MVRKREMSVIVTVAVTFLATAALLLSYRLLRGPDSLDRVVALDSLVAVAMGGLAIWIFHTGDTSSAPAIAALALVGFLGSAAVTRFRVRDPHRSGANRDE